MYAFAFCVVSWMERVGGNAGPRISPMGNMQVALSLPIRTSVCTLSISAKCFLPRKVRAHGANQSFCDTESEQNVRLFSCPLTHSSFGKETFLTELSRRPGMLTSCWQRMDFWGERERDREREKGREKERQGRERGESSSKTT